MVSRETTPATPEPNHTEIALDRLRALEFRGPLLILTHDNPDPDSLASASALRYLLHQMRGIEPTVAYSGIIGRAENRAMVSLLPLHVRHVSEVDLDAFSHLALIDAQPYTGNTVIPEDRLVDIVIDHHPLREQTLRSTFYDVRDTIGASATLLTQYLRAAGLPVDSLLATALLYGIRSETQDLGRETSDEDREAYQYLLPLADAQKLSQISKPTLDPQYFRQMSQALGSLRIASPVAICRLQDVIEPDFIPEMADFFIRMEGLEWVLVYGRFRDRIYLSIRTNAATAAAGETMQRLLHGLGRGGGHGMRAGGNIDPTVATLPDENIPEELDRRFLQLLDVPDADLVPLEKDVE